MPRFAPLRKLFLQPLMLVLALLPLSAQADQRLRLLVWEGFAPADQVRIFEDYIFNKYAQRVTLDISYLSDPSEFYDALRRHQADIVSPTHNLFKDQRFDYIDKKLILPLNLDHIPNFNDLRADLQSADYLKQDGEVYGVPFVHGSYALAYRPDRVASADSWNIFWQPEYQHQYALSADYYEVNIYITALSLGLDGDDIHDYGRLRRADVREKLRLLVRNAGHLWQGVDKPEDLERMSLAAVWGFSLTELRRRGQPWRIADPVEGAMGWVDNYAIGASLRDKPFLRRVAEEWLNFVLSPDFQLQVVVRSLGSEPVNPTIMDHLTGVEVARFNWHRPGSSEHKRILWPTLTERNRNGLKRLWREAIEQL